MFVRSGRRNIKSTHAMSYCYVCANPEYAPNVARNFPLWQGHDKWPRSCCTTHVPVRKTSFREINSSPPGLCNSVLIMLYKHAAPFETNLSGIVNACANANVSTETHYKPHMPPADIPFLVGHVQQSVRIMTKNASCRNRSSQMRRRLILWLLYMQEKLDDDKSRSV